MKIPSSETQLTTRVRKRNTLRQVHGFDPQPQPVALADTEWVERRDPGDTPRRADSGAVCLRVGSPGVGEWVYFIHAPRENFAATMTEEERSVWMVHFERLQRLMAEGVMILVGPTLGPVNTGIAVFEAPDEEAARKIMEEDPVIAGGYARGELRPFVVSLLRGRD